MSGLEREKVLEIAIRSANGSGGENARGMGLGD